MTTSEQLALEIAPACKSPGCEMPVVGSSTQDGGHVCKGHNEQEWGIALAKYDPRLSHALTADSEKSLAQSVRGR